MVGQTFELSTKSVAGVVAYDIDTAKLADTGVKSLINSGLVGNVESSEEQIGLVGMGKGQGGNVASSCYDIMAVLQTDGNIVVSEAGRGTRDEEGQRGDDRSEGWLG